jgi:hypothetical protein
MDHHWLISLAEDLSPSKKEFSRRGAQSVQCPHVDAAGSNCRGLYADGDTVIILFDAEATVRDGKR